MATNSIYDFTLNVVRDPALPALVQRLGVLKKIWFADSPPLPPGTKPPPEPPGVGLESVVDVIDSYLWFRQNRWIVGAAVGAAILVPGLIGMAIGHAAARSPKTVTKALQGARSTKASSLKDWSRSSLRRSLWLLRRQEARPHESNPAAAQYDNITTLAQVRAEYRRRGWKLPKATPGER